VNFRQFIDDNGVSFPLAVMRIILAFMLLWGFTDKLFGLGLATPVGMGVIDGGSPTQYFLSTELCPVINTDIRT